MRGKLAFRLSGEFIRTKVAGTGLFPLRILCGQSRVSKATAADLKDGASVLAALRAAVTKMDEDEVPTENRHLFITPTLDGMIADLDTTKSREILTRFATKTLVPQTRFYTAIDMLDGKTSGEEAGGYKKATGAKNINFMVIHPSALIQFQSTRCPKSKGRRTTWTATATCSAIRTVGIADVYANKLAGIYLHSAAAEGDVKYADSRFDFHEEAQVAPALEAGASCRRPGRPHREAGAQTPPLLRHWKRRWRI